MGLCHRLHWPDEFKQLAADRKAKGFNVIQIVAGLYPDMHPFDPRGANEAGFPWEPDYARIRPEYFDAADARLDLLVDRASLSCIVGAWGYYLPRMGEAKMKAHWRYLIAAYGAWPVVVRGRRGESAWYRRKLPLRRSRSGHRLDRGAAPDPRDRPVPPPADHPSDGHQPLHGAGMHG